MTTEQRRSEAGIRATPHPAPSYRENLALLDSAQKSGKGAPAYSRYVNRRLGRMLAAGAALANLTPNVVTLISAAFSFAGIAVLALAAPSWFTGVTVSVLLVIGYALDAADGQLARLQGGGSVAGEWLDHVVDCFKISSLHLAVLVSLYRFGDVDERWLLIPIAFTVVGAASFFAQILNEQLRRNQVPAGSHGAGGEEARPSVLVSLAKVPTDYGLLCLTFVLLGSTTIFIAVYAAMLLASAAYLGLALVTWYGRMRRLDEEGSA